MRRSYAFCLLLCVGCKQAPRVANPSMLHITMADTCAETVAKGTMQGVEYSLERPSTAPMYVACYGPLEPSEVGKDFPVVYNRQSGTMMITVPGDSPTKYVVTSAQEVAAK